LNSKEKKKALPENYRASKTTELKKIEKSPQVIAKKTHAKKHTLSINNKFEDAVEGSQMK
jgi:hypothetical protein